jgi:bacteriocin-like protein
MSAPIAFNPLTGLSSPHSRTQGGPMSDPKEEPKQPIELSNTELEQVTGGATDYFLKIEGIEGESQDDKHKNEII